MLTKLIKYALMSSTIKAFRTEKGFFTRGTINLWIVKPYGVGTTAIFKQLEKDGIGRIVRDYTVPGIIGTIKKDGTVVVGEVKKFVNTTVFIDEFQEIERKPRAVLLSLMEDHRYSRTLGYEISQPVTTTEDGFEVSGIGTTLDVFVRASYIVSTMRFKTGSVLELALLSRGIPIFLDISMEEQLKLYLNADKINIKSSDIEKAREELKNQIIFFPERFRERVANKYKEINIRPQNIVRAMWDYSRIAFLQSYEEGTNEITPEILDEVDWLIDVQRMGYAKLTLTRAAYEIFIYLFSEKKTVSSKKIAEQFGFSREYAVRMLDSLLKNKLISKTRVSKGVFYYV